MQRTELMLAHETSDAVLTAGFSGLPEIQEHAWCSVDPVAGNKGGPDQLQPPSLFLRAVDSGCFSQS